MRTSDAFPSAYIAAGDLQDREASVTIRDIQIEEIGKDKDRKPVLYFKGKEKGLVLNKTNANTIESVYGDEMDDWIGAEIVLYPTMTDFQGRQVAAIRVKMPRKRPASPTVATAQDERSASLKDARPLDDDIPF